MSGLMLLADDNIKYVCGGVADILSLVGWILTVFKIAIPLIIIALGIFDLAKAAISSKPEDIKKSATSLLWRFVGGVVIFFIPSLVMLVFGFVGGFSRTEGGAQAHVDWDTCYTCITKPWVKTGDGACVKRDV